MSEALQAPQEGICTVELVIPKRKYVTGLCTKLLHYSGNYIYRLTVTEILQVMYEFRLIIRIKSHYLPHQLEGVSFSNRGAAF